MSEFRSLTLEAIKIISPTGEEQPGLEIGIQGHGDGPPVVRMSIDAAKSLLKALKAAIHEAYEK